MPTDDLEARFTDLVREHASAVVKVARAYTRTAEDCQDLVQEILLQVWRSLPRFEGRSSAITWLYRVALNTALGWQRNDVRRRLRQSFDPSISIENVVAVNADSVQHAAHLETVERLYEAIRQLPKTDAALVLLYLDNLSYRDMAEVLGISESNIGVKLNRVKKVLSELMREGAA